MSRRPASPRARPSWLSDDQPPSHPVMGPLSQDIRNRNDNNELIPRPIVYQSQPGPPPMDRSVVLTADDAVQEPYGAGGILPSPTGLPDPTHSAMELSGDIHGSINGLFSGPTSLVSGFPRPFDNSRELARSTAQRGQGSLPEISVANHSAAVTLRGMERSTQDERQDMPPGSHTSASAHESHTSVRSVRDLSMELHRSLPQTSRLETRTADGSFGSSENATTVGVIDPRLLNDRLQAPTPPGSEASSSVNPNPRIKRRRATSLTSSRSEPGHVRPTSQAAGGTPNDQTHHHMPGPPDLNDPFLTQLSNHLNDGQDQGHDMRLARYAMMLQDLERDMSRPKFRGDPSQLPRRPIGDPNLLFITEIIPCSFNKHQKASILDIFQTYAQYIPAYVSMSKGSRPVIRYHSWKKSAKIQSLDRARPLGPGGRGWPKDRLPLEVFENIARFLPRECLQRMRLVSREFEQKVSNILFHTVVVPFREEIYGMMLQKGKRLSSDLATGSIKGKDVTRRAPKLVHDGMKVFQAWGPNIRKFAMAFEVHEGTLERPPTKGKFEVHPTFWGSYKWPHPYYNRFEACEGLERKADEFRCMSEALSNLTEVRELALSIDSGLGWINGPDLSDRARLFREKPQIFSRRHTVPDSREENREEIWQDIRQRATLAKTQPKKSFPHPRDESDWHTLLHPAATSRVTVGRTRSQLASERPLIFDGVELEELPSNNPRVSSSQEESRLKHFQSLPLVPKNLTTAQQEWLLETEWAQRAFLSSFCMALYDNTVTFQHVRKLSFTRISSRYLPVLDREDIWKGLANLESLTISVIADWRNIQKTESGLVESTNLKPSGAAALFYALLKNQICSLANIKSLELGFIGGGEHQPGIYGRNRFVLPAPVLTFSEIMDSLAQNLSKFRCETMITFPHVDHLTFSNCYFSPRSLKIFIQRMQSSQLRSLTLKSVSLTAYNLTGPVQHEEFDTSQAGFTECPHGRPRYKDPAVGNLFELRGPHAPMPMPNTWTNSGLRIGSWGEIIDGVSPGIDLDLVRYAFGYYDKALYEELKSSKSVSSGQLQRIAFDSCGYVILTHSRFKHQPGLPAPPDSQPACLRQRILDLAEVSMFPTGDNMLGNIVTELPDGEESVLKSGFGFQLGWQDSLKAVENLEDGQPEGGSGRFSGSLQQLTFKLAGWRDGVQKPLTPS